VTCPTRSLNRSCSATSRRAFSAAWGWTLEEAAGRYNALRAKGAEEAVTSLTGSRLSEWENWPLNTRKPSFLSLCLLAEIYHCPVLDLIDFRDREHLPPASCSHSTRPEQARRKRKAAAVHSEIAGHTRCDSAAASCPARRSLRRAAAGRRSKHRRRSVHAGR